MLQRPEVIFDLGDGACPDNDRRDTFVAQQPCQSHLGKGLAALPGDFMQAPDPFRHPARQHIAPQRALRRHARAFRNTVQVTVGQQPLCQRRKGHEPGPGLGIERQDARRVGFAVEQVVAILEKQAGHVALGQVTESETCRGQRDSPT